MAEPIDENVPQVTEEISPVEQRAMDQGWVPQEDWSGDPADWRPAKEFLDRGELFRKIEDQKRELKQMRAAMEEFGKHHSQVKELAYKQALADLRTKKKEALEAGDADAVIAIDDRIAETREAQKQAAPATPQTNEPHPAFVQWQAKNAWYQSDRVMKLYADDVAVQMYQRGINDPVEILEEVDRQVRKQFKDKFENPARSRPGAVEGAKPVRKENDPEAGVKMSDAEKRIMQRIIATGAITKEKYLEEFKARQGG
jgi:hypothetical protein